MMGISTSDEAVGTAAQAVITAELSPDRVVRGRGFEKLETKAAAVDWLFAGIFVMTAWWYLRVSSGQSFLRDDWKVATRSLSVTDLFEPHNRHLSVVPLAIYRGLLGAFGFETYTPYRLLGIASLLFLGAALFLLARSRVGGPVGMVMAVSVLWLPMMNLTPFLANFHITLGCAVLCAAAMPSFDRRSDIVMGLALTVAFATSSIGVAVAAACVLHAVVFRPHPARWMAVAVPSLLWVVWWRTLGNEPRPPVSLSIPSALELVAQGVVRSFGALTGGSWVGGVMLLSAWMVLLVYRVRADRMSAVTQLAWMAGVVAWWVGLVWSRPQFVDSPNMLRYSYVGAVLVLLSVLPAFPIIWPVATRPRRLMIAAALLISAATVLVNHEALRNASLRRAAQAERAELVLFELEHARQIEPTRRLIPLLARITVQDYHLEVVARYGSPVDLDQAPDQAMIERHAMSAPIVGPAPSHDPACAAGPVPLQLGGEVALHTRDEPAMVRARRFGSWMAGVRRVPAHRSVVVRFPGPTTVEGVPWMIDAPGACIHQR